MVTVIDYCTYESSQYRITLRYEKEWKQNCDYSNRFDGEDVFFQITAFDGVHILQIAKSIEYLSN